MWTVQWWFKSISLCFQRSVGSSSSRGGAVANSDGGIMAIIMLLLTPLIWLGNFILGIFRSMTSSPSSGPSNTSQTRHADATPTSVPAPRQQQTAPQSQASGWVITAMWWANFKMAKDWLSIIDTWSVSWAAPRCGGKPGWCVLAAVIRRSHSLTYFYRASGVRSRRVGNVQRLVNEMDKDDDMTTYNGNSTQQMWRHYLKLVI